MIESHFSTELSEQATHKLSNLIKYLNYLQDSTQDPSFPDHSIRLFQKLITTLINNFSLLSSDSSITAPQISLLSKLKTLKSLLTSTKVHLQDSFQISIWDLIENPDQNATLLEGHSVKPIIFCCSEIIQMIHEKSQRSMLRGGFLFGTIDYMRADLLKRFTCEQFWVQSEGAAIDCIWISGIVTNENTPVIIFCNPNAAYYEFSYFQTDWIELYVGSGVDLVMWNYRGYGRSTGRPDLGKMKKDAEKVAETIKSKRGCKVIGIHGESLGGSIAAHLAKTTAANFLFADRTFTSLSLAAKYSYGSFASRIFGPKDADSVKDFVEAKCFKLLSCDCNDIMIDNLGSLKSGVAAFYFEKNPERFPFGGGEIESLIVAIHTIQGVGKFPKCAERKKKGRKRGSLDSGNIVLTLVNYLDEILCIVDSGGESFMDLFEECSELKVKSWVWVLGLWGSTPEVYSNTHSNNTQSAIDKLSLSTKELLQVIQEYEKSENPSVFSILSHFRTVLQFLIKCRDWVKENSPNETIVGKLLPLRCGHSGSFNALERFLYEQHLQSAGIF